ncbi:hypothetical protein O181_047765 [Austropuccinia psidii MF-1]|uniref:Uncharacterized protein n=1 Tax=Austropuccinia psidii MF-1 TaxID=1389203 RepID=A0A9Q3DQT2_9BASI|nr:hypothetical protein [Austropuccinia psidii MF-1]
MAPRPYPASVASLANYASHHPPGQYLISGPGGLFTLPEASGPSDTIQRVWGLSGPNMPFRPPTASMVRGPWAVGPVRPLLAEFQGGRSVGPPETVFGPRRQKPQKWPKDPNNSKVTQEPKTIKLVINDHGPHYSTHCLCQ